MKTPNVVVKLWVGITSDFNAMYYAIICESIFKIVSQLIVDGHVIYIRTQTANTSVTCSEICSWVNDIHLIFVTTSARFQLKIR